MAKEMQLLIFVFVLIITLSFMMLCAEARNLHAFQQQAMEYGAAGLRTQSSYQSTISTLECCVGDWFPHLGVLHQFNSARACIYCNYEVQS
ncbi:hypothetical protein AAZX31_08G184100 [Glycine max]|nr:hypothetical protein GLYMA_08G186132v4 [Glycine max]KAH1051905.1 hypothetical protein GYH30_021677 [Glycine max]